VSDGLAATAAYERHLESHKAPPALAADIGLAPRSGTYSGVTVERDRIVFILDSNLPTGKFAIAGKPVTFSARQEAGKRVWVCARGDLEEVLMPETCRGR